MEKIFKWLKQRNIQIINQVLAILMIGLLIAIIGLCYYCILDDSFVQINKNGYANAILYWQPFFPLFVALFSVTTLFVASFQLRRYLKEYKRQGDLEEAKAIIEIRKMLDYNCDNFDIHKQLELEIYKFETEGLYGEKLIEKMKGDADILARQTNRIKCFRYLGTLELACIMVQNKIITLKQFRKQYGYRIDNIKKCSTLIDYLNGSERKYWKDLLWIMNKLS